MSRTAAAPRRPSLGALTGLRFVAAAQVVLFHSMGPRLDQMPHWLASLVGAGYTGVSLFFVLSGFVLAYNYLTPGGGGVKKTGDFFAARVARIYPVYLVGVLLALPGLGLRLLRVHGAGDALFSGAPVVLSALTLTQSWIPSYACQVNCPGWSLSVEAFFYLMFPLIAYLLTPRSNASLFPIVLCCWAASLLMGWAYVHLDPDALGAATPLSDGFWLNALKYNPLVRLPEFMIGMSLGLAFLRAPDVLRGQSRRIAPAALGIVLVLLVVSRWLPYPVLNNGLLLGPFALLILALAAGSGILAGFLSSPPMLLLGEASYALYILHVPIHSILRRLVPPAGPLAETSTGFLIVYLLVSVLVAVLVLRWLEEPARVVLRKRLVQWMDTRRRGAPQGARENVPATS